LVGLNKDQHMTFAPVHSTLFSPAEFDAALASGKLADHPYLPILKAIRAGKCSLLSVFQTTEGEPLEFQIPALDEGTGIVVQIGDDLDASYGPSAFNRASVTRLMAEAKIVVLQVAAFQEPVMAAVAAIAAAGHTVLIIETREEHEIAWFKFLEEARGNLQGTIYVTTRKHQV
jgi:hypothetical protein